MLRPRNPQYYKKFHFGKIKSFLKNEKWTKINVQIRDAKNVLTDEIFGNENFPLSSQIKR